ncbi:phospholipid phosphatase 3-like isoform 2-T2 [Thomomys bottae]
MELGQKVTAEGSPNTWASQRSARLTSSEVSLASSSPPPSPRTVKAVSRGRAPPPDPLLGSRTSTILVALDLFCVMLVSIPSLLIENGLVAPHLQGFFCNDTSIKYPRVSHYVIEDSAITTIGFFIFIFMISLGEMILVWGLPLGSQATVTTYLSLVYKQLGTFIFGAMASSSLTGIAQITTGHLRPHFLAVCLPDPTTFSCEGSYIANYTCTGNPSDVLEARKSFYSEQASFGMYCTVYLVAFYIAGLSTSQATSNPGTPRS